MRKPPKVSEAHIQRTVCDLLALDGWRIFRTELTVQRERGRVVGERGMPDVQAIRYLDGADACMCGVRVGCVCAAVMHIEFKAANQQPRTEQLAWHDAERARGALVLVVDDIDTFTDWYKASGLNRRIK